MRRIFRRMLTAAVLVLAGFSINAATIQFFYKLDWSAVSARVNYTKLTCLINVGTASAVVVEQDGVVIPSSIISATQAKFTATNRAQNILVTITYTGAVPTGAITKCPYYDNKSWAYSFTFDDSMESQYTIAYPIFAAKGYRGGIGVNTGNMGTVDTYENHLTWAQLDALRAADWGIYNHSVNHLGAGSSTITCANMPLFNAEVIAGNTTIEARYPGYKDNHYVYPFNDVNYLSCLASSGRYLSAEAEGWGFFPYDAAIRTDDNKRFNLRRQQFYGTALSTFNKWASDTAAGAMTTTWLIAFSHGITPGSAAPASIYFTNEATLLSHINYIYSNFGEGGNNSMWFAPTDEVYAYYLAWQQVTATRMGYIPTASVTATNVGTKTVTQTPTVFISATVTPSITVTSTQTITPTFTATSCGSTVMYRVNCGGTSFTDSSSFAWAADKAFTTGTWGYQNGAADSVAAAIGGTTDDTLYQSETYGDGLTYRFTLPIAGQYQLRFLFAEIYTAVTAPGQRVFSVYAEGTPIITNLDIFSKVGLNYAYQVTATANVADGELTLTTSHTVDLPKISAIEVIRVVPCLTNTVTVVNTPTNTKTVTQTNTATVQPSSTATKTNTNTVTHTSTSTYTVQPSNTATKTNTNTVTQTVTHTNTKTVTDTITPTATKTSTNTITQTPTKTATGTLTPDYSATETASITVTLTGTPPTFTATPTQTETITVTCTETTTQTDTATQTASPTQTESITETVTLTVTQTDTQIPTQTVTLTNTQLATEIATPTITETLINPPTLTNTPTITQTSLPTAINTGSVTETVTPTTAVPATQTITPTDTPVSTQTAVPPTATATQTVIPPTFTSTNTPAPSVTFTPTYEVPTATFTPTTQAVYGEEIVKKLGPNPNHGRFRIGVTDKAVTMKVFTSAYRLVFKAEIDNPAGQYKENEMNMDGAANGVYFILFQAERDGKAIKELKKVIIIK